MVAALACQPRDCLTEMNCKSWCQNRNIVRFSRPFSSRWVPFALSLAGQSRSNKSCLKAVDLETTKGPRVGSDIEHPVQGFNEHPRPTDHRDSNEMGEVEDAGAHGVTSTGVGQLEIGFPPRGPAG